MLTSFHVHRVFTVTAILSVAVSLFLADTSEAAKNCGNVGFEAFTDAGAFQIVARNTSCRTARSVARLSEQKDVGGGDYRYEARGFTCRGKFVDYGLLSVKWKCTDDHKRITFTQS